jgi:hypothetical protein
VGPRPGLDAEEKRKILAPAGNRTPSVQPVAMAAKLSWLKSEPTAKAGNICSRIQAFAADTAPYRPC